MLWGLGGGEGGVFSFKITFVGCFGWWMIWVVDDLGGG